MYNKLFASELRATLLGMFYVCRWEKYPVDARLIGMMCMLSVSIPGLTIWIT